MAARLQAKFEKEEQIEEERRSRPPLQTIASNIRTTRKRCMALNQDYCVFITGREGSGKSTLASHIVTMFDPDFNVDTGMIYELKGTQNSLVGFMDQFKNVPFKAAWYDEAVSVLFSQRHSTRASAEAQELFKIKRESRHFDILVSPSFWDLVPDIRERRVRTVLYCFYETVRGKTGSDPNYVFKFASFSGEKIARLAMDRKIKYVFGTPALLFKHVKPDFVESFPPMAPAFAKEYMRSKHAHRDSVLDSIRGKSELETQVTQVNPKKKNDSLLL